jgi:hypothetical protein
VWFATIFVFFTLIKCKRSLYLLPLFPAAALLVGRFFDACASGEVSPKALDLPAALLGVFLVGLSGALLLLDRIVAIPDYLDGPAGLRWIVAVVLGVGGVALLGLVVARRRAAVLPAACATMVAFALVMTLAIFPALNSSESARFLCDDLMRDRQHDEPVAHYRDIVRGGAYRFYTRLPIADCYTRAELDAWLRGAKESYVIVSSRDYNALEPETVAGWRLVAARQVGHRRMMVFRAAVAEPGQD